MPSKAALKKSLVTLAIGAEKLVRGKPACSPEDLSRIRDFLFLQYMQPLGYCVHDTPIYQALRNCMPEARITVATRGAGFATLRHNPNIDNLLTTTDPFVDTFQAARELRSELRRRQIHPAVGITNFSNPRTRISILNLLVGKQIRLGHTLAPELYHLPQKYDWTMSLIDNNLCLVSIFGCPTEHVEPHVFFNDNDVQKIRALLEEHGIVRERPLTILVTQTSGGQRTGWHLNRFAQVIQYISRTSQIVFVGTAADATRIEALHAQADAFDDFKHVSLAGQTSIPEVSALLCMADFVVSLDTGTMHIARAAGVPMVVLGPSWQKPLEWLPLGIDRIRILRGDDIDQMPENYQLDEITVNHVIEAYDELNSLYPPSYLERDARVRKSTSYVDHGSG